nr:contractile injection system protein, VgrG/Pvc8 family [Erwinia mallotivora]
MQHQESSFDFIRRLMELEGIYFFLRRATTLILKGLISLSRR